MAVGFNLETITQYMSYARDELNIKTATGLEAYIRSRLPVPTEKQEELRAAFEEILPNQNVIFPSQEEMRQRRLEHANTYSTYIHLVAEYGSIDYAEGTRRNMRSIYKLGQDQDAVDYNNHLRETIESKDYAELGRIYGEHIMNLPSCDPEMLENVSAMDAPGVLRELYPLYIAVQEAKGFLDDTYPETVAIKAGMSEESKQRLAELVQYMDAFTNLKGRCDNMFSPYYPYIDTSRVPCTQENLNALTMNTPVGMSDSLQQYFPALGSTLAFTANAFNDDVKRLLEKASMDPNQTVVRDFCGRTHPLVSAIDDCAEVLKRGEPVFCTSGNQLKAFRTDGRKVVEVQLKEAMEDCLKNRLPTAVKDADNLINSRLAAPLWMLTGSTQYKGMQRALAEYQKAVKGQPGVAELEDPAALAALNALEPAARAYFGHKGVDLTAYSDFETFYRRADMAEDMSRRELARMKSAYDILNLYHAATGALDMQKELGNHPAYREPLPRDIPYDQKVQQANAKISDSAFLNDPVEAVGNNNAGEALRQDIKNTLTDPQKGVLNKKFFTTQDRQAAEDVLAKAVILSMIRSGRTLVAPPTQIENNYMTDPKGTIDMIKRSPAFREAKGDFLTPDGLRKFLNENRQTSVNKAIVSDAVEQKAAANHELQNQNQPQLQANAVLNANAPRQPQPEPQLQGMGAPGV